MTPSTLDLKWISHFLSELSSTQLCTSTHYLSVHMVIDIQTGACGLCHLSILHRFSFPLLFPLFVSQQSPLWTQPSQSPDDGDCARSVMSPLSPSSPAPNKLRWYETTGRSTLLHSEPRFLSLKILGGGITGVEAIPGRPAE